MKRWLSTLVCVALVGVSAGCSGSDGGGEDPAPVGGINGPARVDPDAGATLDNGTGG